MSDITLWDAHAHIQAPWFTMEEITSLLNIAEENFIEGIINVVSSPVAKHYEKGIELAKESSLIYTNFGLQPTEATDENFVIFQENVTKFLPNLCAIGEVGLDYYWVKDEPLLAKQREIFIKCIEVANTSNLPLVVHSRKAENHCLDLLEEHSQVPVVMHGMEANDELAKRLIDLQYFITLPTSVCIRKKYLKIAELLPLELIMLETDSPFQLPFHPQKNEKVKNTPYNINLSAKKLAEIKDVPIEDISFATTKNVFSFFRL